MKKLLSTFVLIFTTCMPAYNQEVSADSGYVVEAEFEVDAPVNIIWETLTDYNNIASFVSMVKESKIIGPGVLQQRVTAHWWFFRKTVDVKLKLTEIPYSRIEFYNIGDENFEIYEGRWELKDERIVKVSYVLVAKPAFFIPKGIIRSVLRKETNRYVQEIKEEIYRRKENK